MKCPNCKLNKPEPKFRSLTMCIYLDKWERVKGWEDAFVCPKCGVIFISVEDE